MSFPESKQIKVELIFKGSGDVTFNLEPNIFPKGLNSLISSASKKYVVDASSCVEDFNNKFSEWVDNNKSQLCGEDDELCGREDIVKREFNSEYGENAFKNSFSTETKLPRFFSGHRFSSYTTSQKNSAIKNFCGGFPGDKKLLLSGDFLHYVREELAMNPLVNLDLACFEKIDRFTKKHELSVSCDSSDYFCSSIKSTHSAYKSYYNNIATTRKKTLAWTPKKDKNYTAYQASNPKIDKLVANQMKAGTQYTSNNRTYSCNLDYYFRDDGINQSLMSYDSAIAKELPTYLDEQPEICISLFLKTYLAHKFSEKDPLKSDYCKHNDCSQIEKQKEIFNQNVATILRSMKGSDINLNACLDLTQTSNPEMEINRFLNEIEKISDCSELKEGSSRIVNGNLTGVRARYVIERETINQLNATVAIEFKDNPSIPSVSATDMFERTKSCLENSSSYFTSPDGEKLSVNIVSKEENKNFPVELRAPINSVTIAPMGSRSDSGGYAADASCATITHEVLHLMGLVDEYHEDTSQIYVNTETGDILSGVNQKEADQMLTDGSAKLIPRYQCRSLAGELSSIMSGHSTKAAEVAGTQVSCKCEDKLCRDILEYPSKKIAEMFASNLSSRFRKITDYCEDTYLRDKKTNNLSELEQLPFAQVESESSNRFVFNHTVARRRDSSDLPYRAATYKYTCECSGQNCEEFKEIKMALKNKTVNGASSCFQGSKQTSSTIIANDESSFNNLKINGDSYTQSSPPLLKNQSFLHPAQFERIKYGTCSEKAKNYNKCAKYAYKDRNPKDCPDKPAMCEDPSKWLLSKE